MKQEKKEQEKKAHDYSPLACLKRELSFLEKAEGTIETLIIINKKQHNALFLTNDSPETLIRHDENRVFFQIEDTPHETEFLIIDFPFTSQKQDLELSETIRDLLDTVPFLVEITKKAILWEEHQLLREAEEDQKKKEQESNERTNLPRKSLPF